MHFCTFNKRRFYKILVLRQSYKSLVVFVKRTAKRQMIERTINHRATKKYQNNLKYLRAI